MKKRKTTRKDINLKARMLAEGLNIRVVTAPVVFMPDPNSEMADYKIPGGADWLVETNLKIVRFYLKKIFKGPLHYLDFVLPFWAGTPLYLYNRFAPGFMRFKSKNTCRPFSSWPMRYHACLIQDEVHRRFQQFPGYLSLVQPLVDYATSNVKTNPLQIYRRNI
jgi:hypothetical protein